MGCCSGSRCSRAPRPGDRVPGLSTSGLLLGVAMLCLASTGCGPQRGTLPVVGTVRYRGEPLADATVIFKAQQADQGAAVLATATTDPAGRFSLVSQFGPREVVQGAVQGRHVVVISKYVPPKGMPANQYQRLIEMENRAVEERGFATAKETAPAKVQLLPPHYSDPADTTLEAIVAVGSANDFLFDLAENGNAD
jgi:hypothetical protein